MLSRNNKIFIIFLIPLMFITFFVFKRTFQQNFIMQDQFDLEKIKKQVEFEYTPSEIVEISKWQNKKFEDMIADAFNGDRGGLYQIGTSFLYGHQGITIDVENANLYIFKSASLGFPPALDQIVRIYLYENPNPFLSLVYINLVCSLNHPEFVIPYHELRNQMIKKFGQNVSKKIEKIAALKMKLILTNQEKLETVQHKEKFIFSDMIDITTLDMALDKSYWQNISQAAQMDPWIEDLELLAIDIILDAPSATNGRLTIAEIQNSIKNIFKLLKTKSGRKNAIDSLNKLNESYFIKANALRNIEKEDLANGNTLYSNTENQKCRDEILKKEKKAFEIKTKLNEFEKLNNNSKD